MKRSFQFLFLLSMTSSMISCSPVLYTTVGQNVPLFRKKGEATLSLSGGVTEYTMGYSAQGAVAVSSSVFIISSLYSFQNNGASNKLFILAPIGTGSGSYVEFGVGKYMYNTETRLFSEVTIGGGFGSIQNSYDKEYVDVNYFKPFIQPSWGFRSKYFEAAITPRIGLVNYTSKSSSLADPAEQISLETYYSDKKTSLVFEPGATIRAGFKNVKFQIQYNYTTLQYHSVAANYNSSFNTFNPVDKNFFSFGVFVLISDLWSSVK